MTDTTHGGTTEPIPNPRLKETLAAAARLATNMGHPYVGTEHLLLALLDDPHGIAGQILNRGGHGSSLRQELEAVMADPLYRTTSKRVYRS